MKYLELLAKQREFYLPDRFLTSSIGDGSLIGRRLATTKEDVVTIYSKSECGPPVPRTFEYCEARMATKARLFLEHLGSSSLSTALKSMDEMALIWTKKQGRKTRRADLISVIVANHSWFLPLFSSEEFDSDVGKRLLGEYKPIAERLSGCYAEGLIPVGFESTREGDIMVCAQIQTGQQKH